MTKTFKLLAALLLCTAARGLSAAATATPSPTPTATYCETPSPAFAANLASGCYATTNTLSYNANQPFPGTLLVVRIANSNGATLPSAITYAGQDLSFLRSDPTFSGGNLATYYLMMPPAGSGPLVVSYASAGCNWYVTAESHYNVDPVSPFGNASSSSGNASSFGTTVVATRASSFLADFIDFGSAVSVTTSGFAEPLTPTCCDFYYGAYEGGSFVHPGPTGFSYTLSSASQYTDQLIEIRGVDCSGAAMPSPTSTGAATATASPTSPDTATATPAVTATATASPTATNVATATVSPTVLSTSTPSPTAGSAAPTPLPAGCLTPGFTFAQSLASGCYAAANTLSCNGTAFGGPTAPGALLLVRISNTNGALPSSIHYAGQALNLIRSDPTFDGGVMASYYLLQPAAGANNLVVNFPTAGCGWFITASDYYNVDPGAPVISYPALSGTGANFTSQFICSLPCSILTDFFCSAAAVSVSGPMATEPYSSGCCDNPQGLWQAGSGVSAGFQTLNFTLSATTSYTHQFIEVRGVPCGAYVSVTPTPPPATAAERLEVFPNLLRGPGASAQILLNSPRGGDLRVRILRSSGRGLRDLWTGKLGPKGSRTLVWDGRDDAGQDAGSGVYYVLFIDGDGTKVMKKALVIR